MYELKFSKKINSDDIEKLAFDFNDITYGSEPNVVFYLDDVPIGVKFPKNNKQLEEYKKALKVLCDD